MPLAAAPLCSRCSSAPAAGPALTRAHPRSLAQRAGGAPARRRRACASSETRGSAPRPPPSAPLPASFRARPRCGRRQPSAPRTGALRGPRASEFRGAAPPRHWLRLRGAQRKGRWLRSSPQARPRVPKPLPLGGVHTLSLRQSLSEIGHQCPHGSPALACAAPPARRPSDSRRVKRTESRDQPHAGFSL